jgi:uncharacterized protein with HEPN domain
MKRSYTEFLQDIIDAIDEAESFVDGVSLDIFTANREKILAVVKLLEIIGEAVKKIPDDKRKAYTHLPWKGIAGMRDMLVHEYWQVDVAVVWATVQQSLPELKLVVLDMLEQESTEDSQL